MRRCWGVFDALVGLKTELQGLFWMPIAGINARPTGDRCIRPVQVWWYAVLLGRC